MSLQPVVVDIDLDKALLMSKAELREAIAALEEKIKDAPQLEVPLKHYFSKGVYGREIALKAGTLIVGKIHKHHTMNVLSAGEVSVLSIDGAMRIKAPYTFVSTPGAKRVIVAHEDSVWTVFHGTEETDLEKIENEFIAKNYDEVYLASDRSFHSALNALGFSELESTQVSENESDQIPFPDGNVKARVSESQIHGKGLFASERISAGETIAPARIENKRTPAGRYANHSGEPNAEMRMKSNGDVDLVAVSDIEAGAEIFTDYYFNFKNTRGLKCLGS